MRQFRARRDFDPFSVVFILTAYENGHLTRDEVTALAMWLIQPQEMRESEWQDLASA